MTIPKKRACLYGFEPTLLGMLKESLYFAGAEPFEVEDLTGFSKMFKTQPPNIMVMSLDTLEALDFHVMVASDPQFDNVAIIVGVQDVFSPQLRAYLETCASDFFLVSQPYHLKRLTMAVMSQNPWSEVPTVSGKLLLADGNLERRIGVARSLRLAKYDVEFADSVNDLKEKAGGEHPYRMIISSIRLEDKQATDLFDSMYKNPEMKRAPWLIYSENEVVANTKSDAPEELVTIGKDMSAETISFHVQAILATPLKELRKSERLPYFTPVKFIIERINEELWGYSTDISENGIYIRTLIPPPPDTMLTISFKAPTAEGNVQLGARVCWRKEYGSASFPSKHSGFGVEYARFSEPDKAAVVTGYDVLSKSLGAKESKK